MPAKTVQENPSPLRSTLYIIKVKTQTGSVSLTFEEKKQVMQRS